MLMPILQIHSEDMPAYAIVCGDPARAEKISRKLEQARELAFSREYRTFVGLYEGVQIAVVSHGVGSPGAAVCFEELIRAGVTTLIRVGTAGSYTADYPAGSVIVSTAAVRTDGLTRQLVPDGFPAVADIGVTQALIEAAREQGNADATTFAGKVGVGITVTLDAFFAGVEEIPHRKYKQAGALAAEMEIAALYIVSTLRGARAGAIVAIDGFADSDLAAEYDPHTDAVGQAVEGEINAALRALAALARQDMQ
ncbi:MULTISPECIES: nucleoside phosphorylase [unclassified Paenibacillus]|uniref:nucleoside phosphorylase n=1 Tax=unclassified Paenibacillus TaxID=185978 RepID=UPI000CFCA591|nr:MULTISPECIES: nucleoside phosphorylase [unclassified Paenibacillus]PRA01747.1 purine-nucleoside phosphorylase [Paenibacillus sp. MYb63]PRA44441.1 purine-nucleoside phosphorylase [Paenibacillus sp. MYb67]QZN77505.1 nucleoside phosphorylase [Paenibacillus sp. DR312]